jgi:hypothetical protein
MLTELVGGGPVLAVLGDEMRCVHYDRLTSGSPSVSNWSRKSRFTNDALCVRITPV